MRTETLLRVRVCTELSITDNGHDQTIKNTNTGTIKRSRPDFR